MDQFKFTLAAVVLGVMCSLGTLLYLGHETRKAYYACLQVVEKVAKEENKNSGTRIVSLPQCSMR